MRFTPIAEYSAAFTRKAFFSVTVVLVFTAYGCDSGYHPATPVSPSPTVSSPTAPPVTPTPQEANPARDLWRLSTTIVSLEGGMCFWTWPVGKNFDWTLSVDRNGPQVRFVYDVHNPDDNLLFVGAMTERSFTAGSNTYSSSWRCSGSVTFSASVVGSFSPDGQTLTGRERLTYRRMDGGDDLTITFEWSATRMERSATR